VAVRTAVASIYRKLGIRSRTDLVRLLATQGAIAQQAAAPPAEALEPA
jgi:hypothetical protein